LGCVRWPAATAAVGIARATTSPTMIMTFFMLVSPLATWMGGVTFKLRPSTAHAQMTLVTSTGDRCPDEAGEVRNASTDAFGRGRRLAGRGPDPR
jgi:hypothetical protein